MNIIAIRREDKNEWERRAPLIPDHIAALKTTNRVEILVQPSSIRAFADGAYKNVGATVQEDISSAAVTLAIKEIPLDHLQANKTYLFFSHTIKGQPHNMPLLQRLLELNCQLIDYERIVDEQNRRLIFFGEHAGLAGMIDTLHTLGQRLAWEGYDTPLTAIQPTYTYSQLPNAIDAIKAIGQHLIEEGFPLQLTPFVIGIAGYGNVSHGAQAVLDHLPTTEIDPIDLLTLTTAENINRNTIYKVVFREVDTVEPAAEDESFDLARFFQHPECYRSRFAQYLPHLSVLVNCIYWDTPYPRLLSKDTARQLYSDAKQPKLRVIGDISCDIEGAIEPTIKATTPDAPSFVWNPDTDQAQVGVAGRGPVVMAVDNLPCELPIESSTSFGEALAPFIPALAACDFNVDFEACTLPPELKRAMIVYQGELTPDYRYLAQFIQK